MRLRSRSILAPFIIAGCLTLALTAAPDTAEANPMIRPATHGWFATFGMGPAIKIELAPTQFALEQAVGYHFSGTGAGPALGLALAESFGDYYFAFSAGARFWWDIQPSPAYGLYLAPYAQLGVAIGSVSSSVCAQDCTDAAFNMQFGFEVRLALVNRAIVFFRPIAMDMFIRDPFLMRYNLMFGGGVYF